MSGWIQRVVEGSAWGSHAPDGVGYRPIQRANGEHTWIDKSEKYCAACGVGDRVCTRCGVLDGTCPKCGPAEAPPLQCIPKKRDRLAREDFGDR